MEATEMWIERAGAAMLAGLAMIALTSWPAPAAARSDVPPFCVMTGGPRGQGSIPQLCRFYDYQVCLQAAADLHGNCVVNIDYHGPVSTAPAPAGRYRRY
jgi:Protein of unknown function (DUF3551)